MPTAWGLPAGLQSRRLLGFALATFLAHALSLSFIRFGGPLAPAWPPAGLALAALLTLPRDHRRLVFGGYVAIDTISNLLQGFATPPALAYLCVGLFELTIAEALIRRAAPTPIRFARLRDVWVVLGGTFAATAVASLPAALVARHFNQSAFVESAAVWMIGDMIAFIIVTPLTLLLLAMPALRTTFQRRSSAYIETVVLGLVIVSSSVWALLERRIVGEVTASPYLLIVPVLWATLRFGQVGALLAVLGVSSVGMILLVNGQPLGLGGASAGGMLTALQVFVGVLSVTSLVLATALRETQETAAQNARMVEALRSSEQRLRQSQKMEAIGQLAGGVAHDFNNVLSAIMLQLEELRLVRDMPRMARELVTDVESSAQRAARLTRQLLVFSRQQAMQQHLLDLTALVQTHIRLLRRVVPSSHTLTLTTPPEPLVIAADGGMLEQVLLNLVLNARDAQPQGGAIHIETRRDVVNESVPDLPVGDYAVFRVQDTGTGIADEHLPRLFEPFFTTKPPGQGTGLGLATAYGIVQQHRGTIRVTSVRGRGTTMDVWLPLSHEPLPVPSPAAPAIDTPEDTAPAPIAVVLVVEDEATVRRLMERVLEREGYRVFTAVNGVEALDWWLRNQASVDLVLTDLVMPGGMSGTALARELRRANPMLPIAFTSGYDPEYDPSDVTMMPGENFIPKPATTEQILAVVRRQLEGAERTTF
ncbi:MASE1 domain-containing protein [Gemmatimonas sp.]|uniref:MASE1 domain-containing protein n=1 Tax=Gemmatimonas sp. TaxID=1962908 RepID=UPI003DA57E2F